MAYALLANVPAIYGIYTSIFPVIIYCIFGPSKHVSMGTLHMYIWHNMWA
jgi:MFS superfamily sulfate permease-like transporter